MTGSTRAPATRSSLLRHARRLDQVRKGADLLRRKRQSLVEEIFARARTALTSREAIEAQANRAWRALWLALASNGGAGLMPMSWPTRNIDVDATVVDLWGIRVVESLQRPPLLRSLAVRGVLPGPAEAISQEAAREFELLTEQLLDTAPEEHMMRRLGQALSRTTRLVNTLEQRIAVRLAADLKGIRRTLNERERDEHMRIKHLIARRARQT